MIIRKVNMPDNSATNTITKQFMLNLFTEIIRDIMRSISAQDDYQGGLSRANMQMNAFVDDIHKLEENVSWYELFKTAIENIRPETEYGDRDFSTISSAQLGMSYFCELTCKDNAAKGRISKKRDVFQRSNQ